jgi:hypothetical protein
MLFIFRIKKRTINVMLYKNLIIFIFLLFLILACFSSQAEGTIGPDLNVTKQQVALSRRVDIAKEVSQKTPDQLFDINLELDQTKISKIGDLNARVTFVSFGKVPTLTYLTFDILDSSGQVVHTEKDTVSVETEKIYNKVFAGFVLSPGHYTLRLTTTYNVSVTDEFLQSFEVVAPEQQINRYLVLSIGGLILIIFIVILLFLKKKIEDEEYYQ